MIKITKEQHDKMMSHEFIDGSSEVNSIMEWLDEKLTAMQPKNDKEMEVALIKIYLSIPDGRVSKSFMYQILVFNGIIDDGVHDKSQCSFRHECPVLKMYLKSNPNIDILSICWNLNACLLFPHIVNKEETITSKPYLELDDSIIKTKKEKR